MINSTKAFDKSIKTPNVYLLWLKESHMLSISLIRAWWIDDPFWNQIVCEKEGYYRSVNYKLGCTVFSPKS